MELFICFHKSAKKQYFDDTLLYIIIAITGNLLIAFFAESYLWLLLIIPYIIFLFEGVYLKFVFGRELEN